MKIMIISDFIEGQPVVASVRYDQLMGQISKKIFKIVVSNLEKSTYGSIYADINFKYSVIKSRFTQSVNETPKRAGGFQKILRLPFVLSLWRIYSYSEYRFYRMNTGLLQELTKYLIENKVDFIFATVPDIYVLYVVKYLRQRLKETPIIVEVRDILNNKVGKGNPKLILKKAERILLDSTDGLIALTEGIAEHYNTKPGLPIQIIKNGYDIQEFNDSEYSPIDIDKDTLIFSHIGSIYKGRNLKDFVEALIIVSSKINKRIIFNIVGYLDNEALDHISRIDTYLRESNVRVCITGTLPHDEAIQYLKQSDIAVILTHKRGSEYAIPGKTFEYIGACKPIIAVTHDEALINLLKGKYGECAGHNVKSISDNVLKLLSSQYDFSDRLKYSRKKQLADILKFCKKIYTKKINSKLRSEKSNNENSTLLNRTTTL